MKLKSEHITVTLFWLAFAALLGTSIPHVAWLYLIYEPINVYTIATSYGIAIGIDVMTAWLSYVCAMGKATDKGVTVLFIVALSALSNYANYLYDMAHSPIKQVHMWDIQILGGLTTTGYITPIIISCVPFFALGYTFMLSKISKATIDIAELEAQLENKKRVKELRERYQERDNQSFESKAKGTLSSVISVARYAVNEVAGKSTLEEKEPVIVTTLEEKELDTNTTLDVYSDDSNTTLENSIDLSSGSTSARNVSLEEACELIGVTVRTVRQLLSKGILKSPANSEKLVTRSSIDNYLAVRKQRKSNKPVTSSFDRLDQSAIESSIDTDKIERVSIDQSTLEPVIVNHRESNGHSIETEAFSFPLLID